MPMSTKTSYRRQARKVRQQMSRQGLDPYGTQPAPATPKENAR